MNENYKLVVIHPFADYKRGDVITDKTLISQFFDKNHPNYELHHNVNKVICNQNENTNSEI